MYPKNLLDHCAALLEQLLRFCQPADMVLAEYFRNNRSLGSNERATLADAVYTILRKKNLFDYFAKNSGSTKFRSLSILGLSGNDDRLHKALSESEQQWLAACAQESDLPAQCLHNLPQWLAQDIQAQVHERFDAVAQSLLQQAPLDVRVNTLATKREKVLQKLQQTGLTAQATPYSPWGIRFEGKPKLHHIELFSHGHIEVQDEGSQLLALLLDAKREEIVLDFCAGAGGKTLALGAAMRNTGRLYAVDISAHRLEKLKPRLANSGLSNVHTMAIANEHDPRLAPLTGKVNRVLVDAPCSGLGTLRRSPDLKWRQSPQTVQQLAHQQLSVLQRAACLLKPGGRLVYATCSLLEAENEAIACAFSASHPEYEVVHAADLLQNLKIPQASTLCTPEGQYLRLWPDLHGTDGFFAAIWQKKF